MVKSTSVYHWYEIIKPYLALREEAASDWLPLCNEIIFLQMADKRRQNGSVHCEYIVFHSLECAASIVWCWNPCNQVFSNDRLVSNIDGALNYSTAKSLFLMTPST